MSVFFTDIINNLGGQEKVSDWRFVCQNPAYNTKYVECRPPQLTVVLDNSHKTVGDNRNINLNFNGVLCISPEGCDSQVKLYPTEELM